MAASLLSVLIPLGNSRLEVSMWPNDLHDPESGYRAPERTIDPVEIRDGGGDTKSNADEAYTQDISQRYSEDIGRLRILSANEELDYARRMKCGDLDARDVLITHSLRLVVYVAKRYLGRGLPLLDLVEEGNLGLMHALEKFDPDRGFRLTTSATWWIRQAVERALMNQTHTVYLDARSKLDKQGMADCGFETETVAHLTGKSEGSVRRVMSLNRSSVPLDTPFDINSNLSPDEALADERLYQAGLERYMTERLGKLSDRHRRVIKRRLGLNSHDIASLEELAMNLKVSAQAGPANPGRGAERTSHRAEGKVRAQKELAVVMSCDMTANATPQATRP